MDLSELTPDPRNANKGTERGRTALENSLRTYGAGRSILLDKHGTIIAGNKTAETAADIGLDDVVVVKTDGTKVVAVQRTDLDLTKDNKARELAYADNRVAELDLEFDPETILLDVQQGIDLKDLWSQTELDALLKDITPKTETPEPQVDQAEELREKWQTERGQLWTIGNHRLLCGDSTNAGDVERLLDGNKPELLLTDPPYGMNAVESSGVLSERYTPVIGDESTNVAKAAMSLCKGVQAQIWWGANYYIDALEPAACWLVWDKNNGGSDQMDAELAWTNLPGVTRMYTKASEKGGTRAHPTQKPAELARWCMEKVPEGGVLDLFAGAGWTMVAAETLHRACYGIEIEPKYVAVILERMEQMGLTGVLSADTGKNDG